MDLGIGHQGFSIDLFSELGYDIKNFTIRNGFIDDEDFFDKIFYITNVEHSEESVLIENLKIQNCEYEVLVAIREVNAIFRNVTFYGNSYSTNCTAIHQNIDGDLASCNVLLENCRFMNNQSGGLYFWSDDYYHQEDFNIDIVNCEFSNNEVYNSFTSSLVPISAFFWGELRTNIVNCTFTENVFDGIYMQNAPIYVDTEANAEIVNCIFYDNDTSHEMLLTGNDISVHHSLVENGFNALYGGPNLAQYWDEETNLDANPLFLGDVYFPYLLQVNSPAIDAGTLELPEGVVLPEYDLAGNPRIAGYGVDIGAYEYYSPYGDVDNNFVVESYDASLILMYVVGLDPLPEDPVPWEDWRIARADVDLEGTITAYDGALILQYVVGIIDELPVRSRMISDEDIISFGNDDEFIYLSSKNDLFSLSYLITEVKGLTLREAEVIPQICLFSKNGNRLALASAQALSGKIIRLPYEQHGDECSVTFDLECNGNYKTVSYQFPDSAPVVTSLNSVYPNPFNPELTISFSVGETHEVKLDIYNIRGQKVRSLVNETFRPDNYNIIWESDDNNGNKVSSGIYYIRLQVGNDIMNEKVILMK
jgi:hypothetical protein